MLKMFTVPPGTLLGFKALPFTFPPSPSPSTSPSPSPSPPPSSLQPPNHPSHNDLPAEWAALYPQLSFQSALAYLPNQWDRGHERAQIAKLTTRQAMPILLSMEDSFAIVGISSLQKAARVRELYEMHREAFGLPPLAAELPLMTALGPCLVALCIPDSEGLELAVPHNMSGEGEWLDVQMLYEFEQSTGVPFTIGRVVGFDRLRRNELVDLEGLSVILAERLEEVEATVVLGLIQQAIAS